MKEENTQLNKNEKNPKTLRTYLSDMADVVRENEISVIKVALEEQKARERGDYYLKIEESPKKKILFVVGGIIIILIALAISYFAIEKAKEKNTPKEAIRQIEALISYDYQAVIDLSNITNKSDLISLLDKELEKIASRESIKTIFLNQTINGNTTNVSLRSFLSLMKTSMPGQLSRSFKEEYMVGSYIPISAYEKPHLFLIIGIKDYNQSYAGMLEWEKTMVDDLFSIFHIDVSGENKELFEKPWKDIILKNKDARILYTKDGTDILFYLFYDKNNLIITDNQEALKEIIERFLIKQGDQV
jgi:hypothetical protein